jgi:hypothetical protein
VSVRLVANRIRDGRSFEGYLFVTAQRRVHRPWPTAEARGRAVQYPAGGCSRRGRSSARHELAGWFVAPAVAGHQVVGRRRVVRGLARPEGGRADSASVPSSSRLSRTGCQGPSIALPRPGLPQRG